MLREIRRRLISLPFRFAKRLSRKGLNRWLAERIGQLSPDGRILQVGTAGPIPALVRRMAPDRVVTLDVNPDKKPDIVCDICDMKNVFDNDTFECVILAEVLEHIPMPQGALDEIFRILEPEGVLLGTTPFLFPLHALPHDYYRYTEYGLCHLLRAYRAVEVTPRNHYGEAIGVLFVRFMYIDTPCKLLRGAIMFALGVLLYPLLWLLCQGTTGRQLGPTGYVWVARK